MNLFLKLFDKCLKLIIIFNYVNAGTKVKILFLDLSDIKKFNGLANSFYGWGGEDDDLYHR